MSNTIFLSYQLNDKAFGYANGNRFNLKKVRSICCGDTSNNSSFEMPTHFGTHIDYPYHFDEKGKNSSDYLAQDFVFSKIACISIEETIIDDYLIKNNHLNLSKIPSETELLFIKTGFCYKRLLPEYWEFGYGFHPETAAFLKQKLPNLKAVAFDLISLNSYQHRELGRIAHKEFLSTQNILIIEEVNLQEITEKTIFNEVIIAPLLLEKADGAPVTIIAKIQ
ncbi:MAG TPA: cyclase family protein [Vicingus sp.]|nr:cyclase family protein [Vicingus sp.]HRP59116.1 cyclase family protein [Vicingus sp.]